MTQPHWSALIPHADDMRLLDHVMDWDDRTIHAIAGRHGVHDHPLRDAANLHAVHMAEYGAQASAVHGALLALARQVTSPRAGRLVSLRDMQLNAEYVDLSAGPLDVHAECLFADERGAQYTFKVEQHGHGLASGRVAVIYTES
ncbi:phosphotransferase [Dyella flava]|uniref:Phosphotransferase n=1 Tax=Dyella flava TaxID=1920170 RepID=A0ABS2JZB7_9GAMM|nr:phosphotransferase [Dyella flava]MBM7124338.1 phosphotransferase [Dyella flava]